MAEENKRGRSMKNKAICILVYIIIAMVVILTVYVRAANYYDNARVLTEKGNEVRTETVRKIDTTTEKNAEPGKRDRFSAYHIWVGSGVDTIDIRWTGSKFCSEKDTISCVYDSEDMTWYWLPESKMDAVKGFTGAIKFFTIATVVLAGILVLIRSEEKNKERRR